MTLNTKTIVELPLNEALGLAIQLASAGHLGQFDKSGKPYILHPLHLMNQLMYDKTLAIIAVLHDAIEDTCLTIEMLVEFGFSKRVTDALVLMTHKKGDSYLGVYIPGICSNYDSIRVKRKDLDHNSSVTRLKGLSDKDHARIEKYHKAFDMLGKAKKEFQARANL